MDKKEKTLKSEPIYEGRVICVRKDEVLCPNGQKSLREVVSHHGGVGILIKIDGKFVIEKQYRYPLEIFV